MKRFVSFLLILIFSFVSLPILKINSQVYKIEAQVSIKIGDENFYIDGYKLTWDKNSKIKPFIKDGRTFVPLRGFVESIGGDVTWYGLKREINVKLNENSIVMWIDKNEAFVNGKIVKIDQNPKVTPIILNSRTYVPLRFLVESLNGKIEYNLNEKSISIKIEKGLTEIFDSTNRKVIVPKKIYRIVSLYPMSTIIIFSLKEQDKLIGRETKAKVINYKNIKKLYPNYDKLPEIGSFKDYNPETLISLKPDLIIAPHYTNIKKLEELNLPVLLLNHESPENLLKSIVLLGKVLNKKDESDKITNYFNEKIKYIQDSLKDLDISKRKRIYFAGETILKSFGSDFYQTYMIDLAGGVSVTKDIKGGKIDLSLEDLLKLNPEYIFIPPYFIGTKEDVFKINEIKDIKAIKEKKVFMVPQFILSYDLPSVESILGIIWMAQKINNDKLNIDIVKEIKDFYKKIFNYEISDSDIMEILNE